MPIWVYLWYFVDFFLDIVSQLVKKPWFKNWSFFCFIVVWNQIFRHKKLFVLTFVICFSKPMNRLIIFFHFFSEFVEWFFSISLTLTFSNATVCHNWVSDPCQDKNLDVHSFVYYIIGWTNLHLNSKKYCWSLVALDWT